MAIPDIPSVATIKDRITSDIAGVINQTIPFLPLSFVRNALTPALAGMFYLSYQAVLWVYKQIYPDSADYVNLVLLGAIVNVYLVKAVQAIVLCTVPGTTGEFVTSGIKFYGSNGITYKVTTTTEIIAGEATDVPMQAITSGDAGNLADGEELSITSTVLTLDGTAEVTSTDTDGADVESRESFSARVALRYRTRYITGSPGAYAINGLETPNFIWIGPYSDASLPGTVNVYGQVDNQTDGIPTTAQLNTLEDYLTYDTATGKAYRRPISDTITTNAITIAEFTITIYVNGSSPELNADIQTAVVNHAASLEPYVIGISASRKDVLTNTDTATAADAAAEEGDAKVTQVIILNALTGLEETSYSLLGGEFVKFSGFTFVDVP